VPRVRVHNFSVSLDGLGTGEGQSPDAPYGHAGVRLHEWLFATRGPTRSGTDGGETTRRSTPRFSSSPTIPAAQSK
jgi:hypothetical protein